MSIFGNQTSDKNTGGNEVKQEDSTFDKKAFLAKKKKEGIKEEE